MSQLTTPLTKETGQSAASPGRMPKQIFPLRLSSVWTRVSTHPRSNLAERVPRRHPSKLRLVITTAVAAGFFAVPAASGMPVTDFAELVGVGVVLCEVIRYTLRTPGPGRTAEPDGTREADTTEPGRTRDTDTAEVAGETEGVSG